ncbi:MAG TPA: chorismate mutase [Caulobacteraceae bacterium]
MDDDADAALVAALRAKVGALREAAPSSPQAEAAALRAWLATARDLPPGMLVRAWREAEGAARPAAVAVWGSAATAELARRRFGAAARLRPATTPQDALSTARSGGLAVLALDPSSAWWGRLLAEPGLSAFAILPELGAEGGAQALAVGPWPTEPAGHEETLWVTDSAAAPDAVEDHLGRAGLAARLLTQAGGLKLFALAGYVQREDGRLAGAPGRLTGVVGAVPLPFDL